MLRCGLSEDGQLVGARTLPCLHSFSIAALKARLRTAERVVTCGFVLNEPF